MIDRPEFHIKYWRTWRKHACLIAGLNVGSTEVGRHSPRSHSVYVDGRAAEGIVNDDIGWTTDMVLLPHDLTDQTVELTVA